MADTAPQGFEHSTTYVKAPARDSIADTSDVVGIVEAVLADVKSRGDEVSPSRRTPRPSTGSG